MVPVRLVSTALATVVGFRAFLPCTAFVRSFGQILLPRYLVDGLSSLEESYREYSLAPLDDFNSFWRSKVKVTADRS